MGFTIIELLVVVAIIALLASIGFPSYYRIMQNTRYNTCTENLREIGVALALYRADYGVYPPAPRPDYLLDAQSGAMPYSAKPSADTGIPGNWQEWELVPPPTDPLDPQDQHYQYVDFSTLSAAEKLKQLKVENFGLATLYYLYLDERRNYMRDAGRFHCPELHSTEMVDRGSNVRTVADANRAFDPLWAGYNTYNVTYNYDQFNNDIIDFDTKLADAKPDFLDSASEQYNLPRQLKNPTPPGDTVVCWCYGHKTGQHPLNDLNDPSNALTGDAEARVLAQGQREKVDLVLWVDGTVKAMRPYLMQSQRKNGSGNPYYYWVQPYLYAAGESQ
jgi:prepilin-type N-terminal cleavage/methylation domain-containing protein